MGTILDLFPASLERTVPYRRPGGACRTAARDDMRSDSDVDILVEFQEAATFDRYMDLKMYLEAVLGTSVDLVTEDAVKPRMRPIIEKDMVRVA